MEKYKFLIPVLKTMRKKISRRLLGIVILTIIISVTELIIPYMTKLIFDKGIQEKNISIFIKLLCVTAFLYVLKSIINFFCNKLYISTSNYVVKTVESDIVDRLIRMPLSFFDKYENGYILSRMNEVENIRNLFSPMILRIIISFFSFFGAIGILISIDYRILILVGFLTPVLYCVSKKNTTQLRDMVAQLRESIALKLSNLQNTISAVCDIKGLCIESGKVKEYQHYIQKTIDQSVNQNIKTSVANESVTLFSGIADILTLFLAGFLIISGRLGIGDYIAIVGYMGKIFSPVQQVASLSITIQPALSSLTRLSFFYSNNIEDDFFGEKEIDKIDRLEFKNVTFSYPEGDKVILNNLSFIAEKSDNIVIMGKNGSGKTSIANLIMLFYSNYSGQILFNNNELKTYNVRSLRQKIGIVSQKILLFPGTIEDNITIGVSNITEDILNFVIDICDLRETVIWANKYNFLVAENGKNLSGGQIQKIAIARAIIRKPDILILDEINNNLDEKAQKMVLNLVENYFLNIITIIITHDKKMQKLATKVISLHDEE